MTKYYAVKEGRKPGIYKTWDECKKQVNRFSGAKFKKFNTLEEAEAFVGDLSKRTDQVIITNLYDTEKRPNKKELILVANKNDKPTIRKSKHTLSEVDINMPKDECVAYVDGSAIKNKRYSYGMIFFSTEGVEESFNAYTDGLRDMRNVSGELRGAVKAIEKALDLNKKVIYLHYDYIGIEKWAKGEWKAKKEGTQKYKEFYDSVKNDIDIKFIKVAAHTGNKFNEKADRLAKEALGI